MSPARHPGIPYRRWTPTGWGWVLPKRTNPRWKADLPHPICVRTSRDTMGLRSTIQRPELDAHTGSSRQFRVPDTYNLPTIVVRSRNGIVSERLPLWPGQSWSSPRSEPWVLQECGRAPSLRYGRTGGNEDFGWMDAATVAAEQQPRPHAEQTPGHGAVAAWEDQVEHGASLWTIREWVQGGVDQERSILAGIPGTGSDSGIFALGIRRSLWRTPTIRSAPDCTPWSAPARGAYSDDVVHRFRHAVHPFRFMSSTHSDSCRPPWRSGGP